MGKENTFCPVIKAKKLTNLWGVDDMRIEMF